MNSQQVFTFGQEGLLQLLMVSAPVLLTVLVVGLVISIFQAATQISEATLSFVPKVVAAVARRLVPATAVVRAHWAWRRDLARNHDSYQWRKLVWIGVGLLLGAALGVPGTRVQWVLGAACLAAGGAAEAFWRRQGIGLAPPAAP